MRAFNFAAGPAALPTEVLEQVRSELTDWRGSGSSVMEVSHRGRAFIDVAETAERDLRELLGIGDEYRVLFMQGGASAQFAAIPLNLAGPESGVDYLVTGAWSNKASAEAQRYCRVNVAADEAASGYCTVPEAGAFKLSAGAAYVHYTPNETIGGVEFPYIPDAGAAPLVADMSSTLLSRPFDVARCGLIYAGAQKNIGPAGLTVAIVREELLARAADSPRSGSTMKAQLLYAAIDASGFYKNPVAPNCRSWMNVPFTLQERSLDGAFLEAAAAAAAAGLTNLEGHRLVGGMRASLYNAMPLAGVQALTAFMKEFERRHG